jgi:hypothetical protein
MTKTVFISYSWDGEEHKEWVLNLANLLVQNGVDVILDQYDLSAGNEMTYFMEKAMTADKILLILTPGYKTKADNRLGGVGYEYSMVTIEYYEKEPNKSKIIPILRNGDKDASCPLYVQSKLFHDMSIDEKFDSKLFELIKLIIDKPLVNKPAIGKLPDFDVDNLPEIDQALKKLKAKEDFAVDKRNAINSQKGRDIFLRGIDYILNEVSSSLDYYRENFNMNFTLAKNPGARTIHFSTVNFTYYIAIEGVYSNSAGSAKLITNFFSGPVGFENEHYYYQGPKKDIYRQIFHFDLDENMEVIFVQTDNRENKMTPKEIAQRAIKDVILNEIKLRESKI